MLGNNIIVIKTIHFVVWWQIWV